MSRRQDKGSALASNPARPRMLTTARRRAFGMMLAALVAAGVASLAVALVVGRTVLADDADQRLDRAVDRARDQPLVPVDEVTGTARVQVRDGRPVGGAADDGLAALVGDVAATGETVERPLDIGGRPSRVRAVPVEVEGGDGTVLLAVISSHDSVVASFAVRLLLTHVVLFVAMAGLALLLARRSTQIVESLFRQEDQLMRAVAHEVRSPLSRALVAIDEGLMGVTDSKGALDEAGSQVEDADELIGDLLETARVMSGAALLARDPVALDETAADAARTAATGTCTVVLDLEPVEVVGSARLLRRAVSNLVRNAACHAYDGGPGAITVRVGPTGVTVLDDGPGVPEERLVDLHFETTLTDESQRGPGLGLNICGWVAEMHGGRLVLANRPEGGFSASIALPMASTGAAASRTAGKPVSGTVSG